jgi:hypothetical protein
MSISFIPKFIYFSLFKKKSEEEPDSSLTDQENQ